MRAYPPSKFRVSSFSGSRDSRGQNMPPPPPGREILRPSPGDVLKSEHCVVRTFLVKKELFYGTICLSSTPDATSQAQSHLKGYVNFGKS